LLFFVTVTYALCAWYFAAWLVAFSGRAVLRPPAGIRFMVERITSSLLPTPHVRPTMPQTMDGLTWRVGAAMGSWFSSVDSSRKAAGWNLVRSFPMAFDRFPSFVLVRCVQATSMPVCAVGLRQAVFFKRTFVCMPMRGHIVLK
jgi:hypothetical protein